MAGIDWVAAFADTTEVANMSLGGSGYNQAEYDAIQVAAVAKRLRRIGSEARREFFHAYCPINR